VLIPAINGIRSGGVYFSLDGATNVDPYTVNGGPFPNPDAVQEFRVLTSAYGAEYPSAPGGAINIVTKSGTNQFHGDVFEFFRNGALNARNFFAAKRDNIHRNQYGGTAGGPIIKDKLFIFGSYQRTTFVSSQGGDIQFVPTDAERAGNFSAIPTQLKNPFTGKPYTGNQIPLSDFNSVTSKILANLPHSTAPGGRVEVVHPFSQEENQGALKVDYVMGNSTLVGRYFVADFSQPLVPVLSTHNWLQASGPVNSRWQDAMIGHNYARGRLVNEARFTYQRNSYNNLSGLTGVGWPDLGANVTPAQRPSIQVIQVGGYFNIPANNFNGFPRDTFTGSDGLNINRGRHQISLGVQVQYLRTDENTDVGQPGLAVFAPLPPQLPFTSGNPLADFVLGKPTVFVQGDGLLALARGLLWGFYGNDQIRVTPRFSLNLGLRWDPYWPFHVMNGRADCFRPGQKSTVFVNAPTGLIFPGDPVCDTSGGVQPDLHTFQPRVGFAYSLNQAGTTSIRGGYGIYSMQFPMQSFVPFGLAQPYTRLIFNMFPQSITNPWGAFPGGNPFANGYRSTTAPPPPNTSFVLGVAGAFDPKFKLPSVQQWNLTLEHLFGRKTLVRAAYVGTGARHLSLNHDVNPAIFIPGQCGNSPCSTVGNTDARRPYKGLQSVFENDSAGTSSYNAVQLTVERSLSAGLNFSASYTGGKSLDVISSAANAILRSAANTPTNPFNVGAYRSLTDFDLSHSFTGSFVWQIPSPKSGGGFSKYFLSGWGTTGIWIWQVGMPFSVYSGIDNSLSGVGLDYTDRVPGVSPNLDPNRPSSQLIQEYFNVNAFQQNALGTFGNSGRNILRGPGFNNLDFGVTKRIPWNSDRYAMTFRAEFFNLTNTPHFEAPVATRTSPQFGQILAARDPRIIQLALKFNW
jgi:hypothetical protein